MTITLQAMRTVWPGAEIRLCDPADLDGLGLPPDAQYVLIDVGLPANIEFFFTARRPVLFHPRQHPDATFCRIGTDEGGDLSVTPAGGVEWTSTDTDLVRSVSTSLATFAETFFYFGQYRQRVKDLAEDDVEPLIDAFAQRLQAVDPEIMDDGDNFWVLVLDQMREGAV